MNRHVVSPLFVCVLLLFSNKAFAQPSSKNFDKVWVQGESMTYTSTFDSTNPPTNQILNGFNQLYFTSGNSNICDSLGVPLIICDGFNLYDGTLNLIDNGQALVPPRIFAFEDGFSVYTQTSIILPFGNGKYRLITPTVSDDSCFNNWEHAGSGPYFDLLLYSDIDMKANNGAGRVARRMVPMLENARLSRSQMMACRHGDGKSWWLLKEAADTNLVYKFLLTADSVYGPFIQGFPGGTAHFGYWDISGQSMFSKDGTKYATTLEGYRKVFVSDFDRCTGILSNQKVYNVPPQFANWPGNAGIDSSTTGLSFSPNGRYLYVCSYSHVQQFDLQNATSQSAWTLLSGPDTTWSEFQEYLNIYPGPDGKLYIGNWGGLGGQMSVINSPDNAGTAAGFCSKCLRFPGYLLQGVTRFAGVSTPPCMPNYNLGPTSPPCTLGIKPLGEKHHHFLLYPNPASETITISYTTPGTVTFTDALGKIVQTISLPRGTEKTTIHATNLPNGVYYYQHHFNGSMLDAGKLIIIK
jgi:hypothetical protein